MKIRDLRDVIDVDFPRYPITEETVERSRIAATGCRSSVRVAMGRVYMDAEFEAYRKEVNTSLP